MSTSWAKVLLFTPVFFMSSACAVTPFHVASDRPTFHWTLIDLFPIHTQIPERRPVCVCVCVSETDLVLWNWMWSKESGRVGWWASGVWETFVSYAYTQKHTQTHTHTVSLASIEHQQINLLFPLIWWKRRDSLTLRRQFLSPNIPSLSPSLSFSVLCPAISPVLSPTIVSGLSGYC